MTIDLANTLLIVLAAGRSSRMGHAKAFLPVGDGTLLDHQLARFRAAGGLRAVVVLGSDGGPPFASPGLDVLVMRNPQPDLGQFSSVQIGVRAALDSLPSAPACFVLPVDVPAADVETWHALSESGNAEGEIDAVVPETTEGRGGHPVLLLRSLMTRLVALAPSDPSARLDHLLRDGMAGGRVRRVTSADPQIALNLNVAADFALWAQSLHPSFESD